MFYLIRDVSVDINGHIAWMIAEVEAGLLLGGIGSRIAPQRWWHAFNSLLPLSTIDYIGHPVPLKACTSGSHKVVYSFPSLPLSKHLPNVTCLEDFITQYPEAFI